MPLFLQHRLMLAAALSKIGPHWATIDESTITATGGVSHGNNIESWSAFVGIGTLAQATTGDRPQVSTADVDGLTMAKFNDTEHLLYTPPGTVRTWAGTVYDFGAGNPRRIAAIDTSAVTDKPALEILLEG